MKECGLDAEATAMLNEIYNGGKVGVKRMKRIIGLYPMDFGNSSDNWGGLGGKPVSLGLAIASDYRLRVTPPNILLARRA